MGSRDRQSGLSDLVRLGSLKPITHTELALDFDKVSGLQSPFDDVAQSSATSFLKQVIARSRVLGVSALTLPRSPLIQSEIFYVNLVPDLFTFGKKSFRRNIRDKKNRPPDFLEWRICGATLWLKLFYLVLNFLEFYCHVGFVLCTSLL